MSDEQKAELQKRFGDIIGNGLVQSRSLFKQGHKDASKRRYAQIFTELVALYEQGCIEARSQAMSTIYGIANDLANRDPNAIGSVSLDPYFGNAIAIYSEYLKGDDYERIDWRALNLPTLTTQLTKRGDKS